MRKTRKIIILVAGLTAVALSAVPVMGMRLSGGEWGEITIHGYNLMEFSALACLPLLTPLLLPVILFGNQSKAAQEAELLFLFGGNVLSCVHSCNAAQIWLSTLEDGLVRHYAGDVLYPLGFVLCLVGVALCVLLPEKQKRRKWHVEHLRFF